MRDCHDADLVTAALEAAVTTRGRAGMHGTIFHSDRGSEGGFRWSSQHLDDEELRGRPRGWAAKATGRPPMRSPAEVGADGRYGWRYLDRWRHSNGWRPFLARVDGLPAGFALVRIQGHVHVLQEFFVLRRHRRNGIGRLLAADVFSQFPGAWLVSLQAANTVAAAFWQDAVSRCGPVDWGRETTAGRVAHRFTLGDP